MYRYHNIVNHKDFLSYTEEIRVLEQDRIFCCHGTEHLLDVARIAWIMNLERGLGFDKDIIYAMALLHDIGKPKQYTQKIPHEITGKEMSSVILRECGYEEEECRLIERAIFYHRKGNDPEEHPLSMLLYEADKKSRMCLFCPSAKECNWAEETKNKVISY